MIKVKASVRDELRGRNEAVLATSSVKFEAGGACPCGPHLFAHIICGNPEAPAFAGPPSPLILKGGGDARTCAAVPRLLLPQSLNREMHAIFEGLSLDRPCTRPNGDRNKLPVSKEGTSKARQVLPVCVPAALLLFVQRTATVSACRAGPKQSVGHKIMAVWQLRARTLLEWWLKSPLPRCLHSARYALRTRLLDLLPTEKRALCCARRS